MEPASRTNPVKLEIQQLSKSQPKLTLIARKIIALIMDRLDLDQREGWRRDQGGFSLQTTADWKPSQRRQEFMAIALPTLMQKLAPSFAFDFHETGLIFPIFDADQRPQGMLSEVLRQGCALGAFSYYENMKFSLQYSQSAFECSQHWEHVELRKDRFTVLDLEKEVPAV